MSRSRSNSSNPEFVQGSSSNPIQNQDASRAHSTTPDSGEPPAIQLDQGLGTQVFDPDDVALGDQIDFDTNGLPPAWDDGEGINQVTLTNTILAQFSEDNSLDQRYDQIAVRTVPLSDFRKMYAHGADVNVRERAMRMLKQKIKVSIDPALVYDKDSNDIVYTNMGMHVDLRQMMGNRVGLDAILPNMEDPVAHYDPQWTFKLMTDRRYLQFNGTIDFLSFEPHGHLVYIGVARQVEHGWLVMVPRTLVGTPVDRAGAISYKNIRPMDARSARAVFVMLAFMLSKINYRDIHVTRRYPKLDSDKDISEFALNIFTSKYFDLDLNTTFRLHKEIRRSYDSWITEAPSYYRATMCGACVPVAFSSKHGQNRLIDGDAPRDLQRNFWARAVDHRYLSVYKVALALHIQCSEVGRWDPISSEEIIDNYGDELYDSSNPNSRSRINLDEFPDLFDDLHNEIPIYTPAGFPIPRRAAIVPDDGPSFCALLPYLPKSRSLFSSSSTLSVHDDDDEDALEVEDALDFNSNFGDDNDLAPACPSHPTSHHDVALQVYPTAFIPSLGNWQSKGIIDPLVPLIRDITGGVKEPW
ncbi:hypothetical protein LXA43DRAFT_1104341 [Ganoderma leucocontextum]|nr:hypothetical protein LXA43DRAFT_1104341 [Ganoderma leucocontextum]